MFQLKLEIISAVHFDARQYKVVKRYQDSRQVHLRKIENRR